MRAVLLAVVILAAGLATLAWVYGGTSEPEPAAPAAATVPDRAVASPGGDRWAFLRRPLQAPPPAGSGACPSAAPAMAGGQPSFAGKGPVYTSAGTTGVVSYTKRPGEFETWGVQKFAFAIDPAYRGEVLLRGHQRYSHAPIGFGDGAAPAFERGLGLEAEAWAEGFAPGVRLYVTYIRFAEPGCYLLQADGTDFSQVIVLDVHEGSE